MPDSFEHMAPVAIRMPNGALTSLAGNVDRHHAVAVADLILVHDRVLPAVERLLHDHQPDVVGLSIMTFQRRTALRLIAHIKQWRPSVFIVVGGYDPSLAAEAYEDASCGVDAVVRGEGETTFRDLIRALEARRGLDGIAGLSWRRPDSSLAHNPDRPVSQLRRGDLELPNRAARVLSGYTMLGRQVDVVETSRGCTFDCSFCSIIEMRGRNFHPFDLDRVLADIGDARAHGARTIFLVDDNITLDVGRFMALCRAIIEAGLDDLDYIVQGMTSPFAQHGDVLAPLMRRAGFRYVFLGIENVLADDLNFLRARAKNTKREGGRAVGNATLDAVTHIHRHGMFVVGGLIVGNPDDTAEAIETNLAFARDHIDWPYIQHPTPYPRTPMTRDFRDRGLDRQRGAGGVRRHDRRGEDDAPQCRGRGVPAVACRALDEGAARSGGVPARPVVRRHACPPDAGPHLPRRLVAHVAGPGRRSGGVQALQGPAPARTRVRAAVTRCGA